MKRSLVIATCLVGGCFDEPGSVGEDGSTTSPTTTSDSASSTTDAATSSSSSLDSTDSSGEDSTTFDASSGFVDSSTGIAPGQWDPQLLWLRRLDGRGGSAERADALFFDGESQQLWVAATTAAQNPIGNASLISIDPDGTAQQQYIENIGGAAAGSTARALFPQRSQGGLSGFVIGGALVLGSELDRLALEFTLDNETFSSLVLESSLGPDYVNAILGSPDILYLAGTIANATTLDGWVALRGDAANSWDHPISSPEFDIEVTDMVQDGDGLVVSGYRGAPSDRVAFVRAIASDGTLEWDRPLPRANANVSEAHGVSVLARGGFLVAGSAGQQDTDAWVAHLDSQGREVWITEFVGDVGEDLGLGVTSNDDGIFVCGSKATRDAQTRAWIAKLEHDGTPLGEYTLASEQRGNERALDCLAVPDRVYVAGWTSAANERDGFVAALATE